MRAKVTVSNDVVNVKVEDQHAGGQIAYMPDPSAGGRVVIGGVQGPPGPPGGGVYIGTVDSEANLPGDAGEGDLWVAADTGDGWVFGNSGWTNVGPIRGPDGLSVVSYAQDAEPANPEPKQTWWNPLNYTMQVFHENAWKPVSPDGGHF